MSDAHKHATLYRLDSEEHQCPYGLKVRHLLKRNDYRIDDQRLTSHAQAEEIKQRFNVKTTPQVVINGERIGGYEAVRAYLGKSVPDPEQTSYQPVIALFTMTALLALGTSWLSFGEILSWQTLEWFIGFSMVVLALLKLQDVETFSTMFLNYDLLAKRWVPYSYIYPFAEGLAGLLMVANVALYLAIPLAFIIGGIGAISVFKAVYLDKRELKCACVGGSSNVPLGFVSLTENLMMIAMALWMIGKL
ncbi:glutaredoxin family protein [Pseudidiomarina sediminum]|uniref:glutaredoxin family protein n=1 Tax=Pseudidiomarina sediminum TaxID=431675 RepID=UPI001C9541DC|nr:glutaredoxin [Pseudidiomarina sediminum]MBY6062909.1 glutaredoxin [Pseudidiomarina sediminum]